MASNSSADVADIFRSDSPVSSILPDYDASQSSGPPRYSRHSRPQTPVTYSFTNWGSDSMLLVPPPNMPELGLTYRISVSLNLHPFLPLSYVTRVSVAVSEEDAEDAFVGEFELSLHQTRGVLTMIGAPTRLSNVLTNVDSSSHEHWFWRHGNVQLRWDCRTRLDDGSPMCICYGLDRSQLATFVPPPILASPPLPAAVFTVFPDGHEFFEHILMSMLVVQRKMTMLQ